MAMLLERQKKRKVNNIFLGRPLKQVAYRTDHGWMLHGMSEDVLSSKSFNRFRGKVNLIFTSPPFPLNRKKKYGNETGDRYVKWFASFGKHFKEMLTPDGSIVIEMGNSWEPGSPVMSTLAIRSLLEFQQENDLFLCQEFIWNNPAKLPSPAQWVNIERIRLKDSFTRLWWLSTTPKPKASNKNVLQEYSDSMKKLLVSGKYNSGKRPSEHDIGEKSFLKNNGGSIPPNVITIANTKANDAYQLACREQGISMHPARMPLGLAKFFIRFLTSPGDLVLDPFAGSNITGAAAQELSRYWLGIEAQEAYVKGSKSRFARVKE